MLVRKSTLTLLRLPFSFFLMPVFFFALSQVKFINLEKTLVAFLILHFLIYPASNAYNSFMDRDEGSIGLIEKPPSSTRQLYYVSLMMDIIALILSATINRLFFICILLNILASRAYSYRGIRLKKYPVTGFITVILFQGAITYLMVYAAAEGGNFQIPWLPMLISSLLFGGFYPLTQIYQHQQDFADGVISISYRLGVRGTFGFCALLFLLAEFCLFRYFQVNGQLYRFFFIQIFFTPIIYYFLKWLISVIYDERQADFRHSLRMNIVAAISMNCCFVALLIMNHFE